MTDAGARITPIDVYLGEPDDPCPTILKRFVHRATLVFDEAGTRTLRIRGRRERVGEDDETIELVRTIRVEAESGDLHNRSSRHDRREARSYPTLERGICIASFGYLKRS